jgi:DNA-directed RNA polymerase subunit H (RpoH/RPB5)
MAASIGVSEIEYDDKQKKAVIVGNWIRMLFNRGWLSGNLNDTLKSASVSSNDTCHIQGATTTYALKFIMRKISSVKKVDDIDEFLEGNKQNYKFFIVSQMMPKVQKQLMEYTNVEVFNDDELLENKVDNILVPVHILLTDEEADKYLEEYQVRKSDLPHIRMDDPIIKYYNGKPGQVVKIIRPSVTGGEEIALRVCVPGQII